LRVLIADDDPEIQRMLSTAMWGLGYEPVSAADAMQTVMVARNSNPDVILLDVNMPGGTGLMALERLKALTATRRIPVIAITGSAEEGLAEKVKGMGAQAFFPKPLDIVALMNMLVEIAAPSSKRSKVKGPAAPRIEIVRAPEEKAEES